MDPSSSPEPPSQEDWQYHLPGFLDQLAQEGTIDLSAQAPGPFAGFLYHHRGARVPAEGAGLSWQPPTFELHLSALDGSSWTISFDAQADWDVYLVKMQGDEPVLAWMTDAEFEAEEAQEHAEKAHAVGRGRFSFGLYFESQQTWEAFVEGLENRRSLLFLRPSGRTYVPPSGFDLDQEFVPEELRPDDSQPPDHLGLVDVEAPVP